jgi:hypothetical protein
MGSIGSIIGGIAGTAIGGPMGGSIGSALGGSLGGGGGKEAANQANAINASMPNTFQFLPQQLQQDVLDYAATYRQQANLPYEQYSGEQIAGFTPEEQQAFGLIRNNVGQYSDAGNDALGNLETLTNKYLGAPDQETLQSYMSPYQQSVTDIAKREAVRDYEGNTVPGIASKAAQSGAFGGSRQAILESEASRNLNQQLGDIQSKGLNDAYDKAMSNYYKTGSLGSTLLARQGQLAQTGLDVAGKEAAALQSVGTNIRDMNQSQLDLAYQNYLDKKNYPIQQAELLRQGFQNTGQYFSPLGTPVNPAEAKYAANASGSQGMMSALGSLGSLFGGGNSSGNNTGITWDQAAGLGSSIFSGFGFAEGGAINPYKMTREYNEETKAQQRALAAQKDNKRASGKRKSTDKVNVMRDELSRDLAKDILQKAPVQAMLERASGGVQTPQTNVPLLPVDTSKQYAQTVGFNPGAGGPVSPMARVQDPQPQTQQNSQGGTTLEKIMQKINQIQPYTYTGAKTSPEGVGEYSPEAMAVLSPKAAGAYDNKMARELQKAQIDQSDKQFAYKAQTTPLDALIQTGGLENSQAYADIQRLFASQKGGGDSSLQKFMIKREDDTQKAAKKAYLDLINKEFANDKAGARQQVMEIYGVDPFSGAQSLPGATAIPYTSIITN